MTNISICWEGRHYQIKTGASYSKNPEYLDFVGFCEQLGEEGRRDLLDVLVCNYYEEVEKEMKR